MPDAIKALLSDSGAAIVADAIRKNALGPFHVQFSPAGCILVPEGLVPRVILISIAYGPAGSPKKLWITISRDNIAQKFEVGRRR